MTPSTISSERGASPSNSTAQTACVIGMSIGWRSRARDTRQTLERLCRVIFYVGVPAWLALRCCCLAGPLTNGGRIPCDPAMLRRLHTGDAAEAVAIALRRLRASGIRPPLQVATTDVQTARRWAAALVFPITPQMAEQAVAHLNPTPEGASRA